jgi:acyl-coenzyme A synthetase/AMP-(fatty) acid ligase
VVRTQRYCLPPHDLRCLQRLTGSKYDDLVNILGVSAAGYVPQLFSVVHENANVVWDLLSASNAKALILDAEFSSSSEGCSLPTLPALVFSDFKDGDQMLDDIVVDVAENCVAVIVHSSGTTSGSPKLIRTTHGWISTYMRYKYSLCQGTLDGENVANTLGSLAHVGSLTSLVP